jgi:hypothetical protein
VKWPALCQHGTEPSGFKMRGLGQAEETAAFEGPTACNYAP